MLVKKILYKNLKKLFLVDFKLIKKKKIKVLYWQTLLQIKDTF